MNHALAAINSSPRGTQTHHILTTDRTTQNLMRPFSFARIAFLLFSLSLFSLSTLFCAYSGLRDGGQGSAAWPARAAPSPCAPRSAARCAAGTPWRAPPCRAWAAEEELLVESAQDLLLAGLVAVCIRRACPLLHHAPVAATEAHQAGQQHQQLQPDYRVSLCSKP